MRRRQSRWRTAAAVSIGQERVMRRLLPDARDEDLSDLYVDLSFPDAAPDRPYVYLDMIASVDGAATADGRTAKLGGEADRMAFARLREWCDAILVGAATVRIEGYGPPRPSLESRARRRDRGLAELPRLIVVTASGALNPADRLFSDSTYRPLVLTTEDGPSDRLGALAAVAEITRIGVGRVDLRRAFATLRGQGVERVLCEGGPSLNAGLLSAGLVDELFLTISPLVVGDSRLRIVDGKVTDAPLRSRLIELHEHAGELLARYRFSAGKPTPTFDTRVPSTT